jgi:hypothetical protein
MAGNQFGVNQQVNLYSQNKMPSLRQLKLPEINNAEKVKLPEIFMSPKNRLQQESQGKSENYLTRSRRLGQRGNRGQYYNN